MIDFRVSTLPTLFGEKQDPYPRSEQRQDGIDALGYEPEEKGAGLLQ